ncbi:MAG: cupin domain-containing protein [Pseudomonadota bacterium]
MPAEGRRIIRKADRTWGPYDLDGPLDETHGLIPLSYRRDLGEGTYLMRMDPGAVTVPHEHSGYEDFLMLEGELIDDDGTVIGPGDLVTYAPGSFHNSRTETGCVILVCEWKKSGAASG